MHSLHASLVYIGKYLSFMSNVTYSTAIGMTWIYVVIFHNNDANENNAQIFSADKKFVEVVAMSSHE